jgi:hypothetical protein
MTLPLLASCGASSTGNSTIDIAAVPARYTAGCAAPALAVGSTKVNEGRLAVAYGKCSRLQRDTATWARDYMKGLGGK